MLTDANKQLFFYWWWSECRSFPLLLRLQYLDIKQQRSTICSTLRHSDVLKVHIVSLSNSWSYGAHVKHVYGPEPPYSSSDWLVHVAFVSSVGQSRARGMRLVWFMEKILGFFCTTEQNNVYTCYMWWKFCSSRREMWTEVLHRNAQSNCLTWPITCDLWPFFGLFYDRGKFGIITEGYHFLVLELFPTETDKYHAFLLSHWVFTLLRTCVLLCECSSCTRLKPCLNFELTPISFLQFYIIADLFKTLQYPGFHRALQVASPGFQNQDNAVIWIKDSPSNHLY